MSDPANTHVDGAVSFGSQVITIGSYTSAVAENININADAKIISRVNEVGVVVAEVLIEQPFEGDMDLQLPSTGSTAPPTIGTQFTLKDVGGANLNVKVSKVGRMFKAEGQTMLKVSFRQRYAATV